ncbi:MAG: alkaline phosphatase family protein [Clostridia bacterium]|nr:alkaline phosphatase family protein [Clostridia bacterium]
MNFIDTLKENDLYLTDFTKPTIVDAVRAVYNLCGKNFPESPATKEIKKILDVPKHILFILSDGMGSNLIDNLNDHSILKKNKIMDLQTVNPSTTGCAIPSIVTGEYPCTHGLIGWLSHNKKLKIDYLPVLFSERLTGKSLKEFNISEDEIYQSKSVLNSLSRKSYALFPDYIVDSTFSSFILESNNRIPYLDIHDAFHQYKKQILEKNEDFTYTYMYLPQIDSNEHKYGVYSSEVSNIINIIEDELEKICKNTSDLEIILTADHGQIDVSESIRMNFDKYSKYFYATPGIDAGTATYYVKSEYRNEFEQEFNKDYKDKMFLFKIEEIYENNVFGKEEIGSYIKNNLGEYFSFCKKGAYFINSIEEDEELNNLKGNHSGFSKDEIMSPFIVINTKQSLLK